MGETVKSDLGPLGPNKTPLDASEKLKPEVTFTEEELNAIAKAIFSTDEGYTNQAVLYYTGQNTLEGYQKVLLAPANALEGLVMFGVGCITGETFKNFYNLYDSVMDSTKRALLSDMMSRGWDNCSVAEKSAFVTEMVCMVLSTPSALAKLKPLIPAHKLEILAKLATQSSGGARAVQILGTAKDVLEKVGTAIIASPLDDIAFAAGGVAAQMGTAKADVSTPGVTVSRADLEEGNMSKKRID